VRARRLSVLNVLPRRAGRLLRRPQLGNPAIDVLDAENQFPAGVQTVLRHVKAGGDNAPEPIARLHADAADKRLVLERA